MTDAEAVVRQHIEAFNSGDLDRIAADFADDAVIQTPTEVVRGREDVRAWFANILQLLPPGSDIVIDSLSSADEVVLMTWHATTEAFSLPFVVDTHIVRDGKICVTTMAYHLPQSS